MDSNNQIEPCLSRKSSEGKPQIFTTLRNIDLTLLTILKLHMSIKESLMQRKCLICPPSVGAQVLPVIYRAIKTHYPQLLLRNPPIGGAENQLCQFQTDLITDNMFCTGP
ncbi:hypothetical protein DQK93_16600 [Escherichia coli]|nr:hypothetical protein [Escherichia coli]EGD8185274.1 hypothetical protein [Escherichia coli]EGE1144121.1 hypothetical protein [Escherichia coli]